MSTKHRAACELNGGAQRCLCNATWLQDSLGLGLLVVVVEIAGSWYADSLALLADAAHTLLDALFYGFAIYVQRRLYARPEEDERAWEDRASAWNGALFVLVAAGILFEAVRRGGEVSVDTAVMGWVAFAGLVLNLGQFAILRLGARNRTNQQVNTHNLADAAQSAAVCLAALLAWLGVATPGFLDGVASTAIAVYLAYQGIAALRGRHHH